jgi:hypothetical protein
VFDVKKNSDKDENSALGKNFCRKCGRLGVRLQRCCLTGDRDHPRYFYLCNDCIADVASKSPLKQAFEAPDAPAMSEREKEYETLRQNAFQRLGTDHPICCGCAETDWSLMELHHLEGEAFGGTLVIVCRNCHRKLSGTQKTHPGKLGPAPTTLEKIGHFLLGLVDLLLLLAAKLLEFGEYLIEYARTSERNGKTRLS